MRVTGVVVCNKCVRYGKGKLYYTIRVMTILQAIILGGLQGLTEFIPVSSSGHLVLAQHFMGLQHSASFDALVNLGTFLALVFYFRKRLWDIAMRVIKEREYRLVRNLFISAIPVGLLGLLFADFFESSLVQSPVVVVVMLLVVGVLMVVLDKLPTLPELKNKELTPRRAGVVGLAQAISLIPGTSRSAATMIAGRFMGLSYKQAAEYSFLLSIPVIGAVLLKSMLDPDGLAFIQNNFGSWLASNIASFIGGLVAVSFMLKFLAKGNFKVFGYYRIALSVIIIVLLSL